MRINTLLISFLWLAMTVGTTAPAVGQISHGGRPLYAGVAAPKGALSPTLVAPPVDNEALIDEDMNNPEAGSPMRIGVVKTLNADIMQKAQQLTQKDGSVVRRIAIAAPGANFMSLTFDQFELPQGAELFIYDASGRFVIGRFVDSDVKKDGTFYTQAIPGDLCYLEYREPAEVAGLGKLHLTDVMHGYKDLFGDVLEHIDQSGEAERDALDELEMQGKGALGNSEGSCHIDVACPEGRNWSNQIRSVAAYVLRIGYSGYYCSGALINNTRNDKTPYFLSAYHCQAPGTVVQWTFYFNYQASSCNAKDGPITNTITGATIRAKYKTGGGSDMLLLELDQAVPESYNPYYAGWSRSSDDWTVGCGIHHPGGDEKKISIPKQVSQGVGTTNADNNTTLALKNFIRADWQNKGVTEGGSSGSALFNKNGQIIGQLFGGNSSCSNTLGRDYYGQIAVSWEGDGTKATRLKDWLDPTGSDAVSLSGYGMDASGSDTLNWDVETLTAYPNPTDGSRFQVQANDSGSAVYYVYSMDGHLMRTGDLNLTPAVQSINLLGLRNGAYYVAVVVNKKRYGNIIVVAK